MYIHITKLKLLNGEVTEHGQSPKIGASTIAMQMQCVL